MSSPAQRGRGSPEVVDLVAIADACAPVVACYDHIRALAGRHERPDAQTSARLREALARLRCLPRHGGRLGRAIAVVAGGGAGSSVDETLAALETLRATLGLRARAPGQARPPHPSLALVRDAPVQLGLPGLEADAGHDPGGGYGSGTTAR